VVVRAGKGGRTRASPTMGLIDCTLKGNLGGGVHIALNSGGGTREGERGQGH